MPKVLIISYYWPPSGGSGVQRWLKFAKYLPEFGWEPVILTPENPSFINSDNSLMEEASQIEVLRLPIWEPYQLLDKAKGKKSHQKEIKLTGNQSVSQKIMIWARGNLLIPDPRKFWIRPAYRFLKSYLPTSGIDVIITTGPPHSLHLIGLRLKDKLGIRWIADFRDPWSEWDVLETFRLTSWARKRHRILEKKVLSRADEIISVGWHMDEDLVRLGAKNSHVLTNGFDPSDFERSTSAVKKGDSFIIRHIGSIDDQRDPRPFIRILSSVRRELVETKIELEFIGNVSPSFVDDVNGNSDWSEFVRFKDYIPHNEIIDLYHKTDLLLLVLAHSHSSKLNITGKIFEYVASGCPIVGIGDTEGDAARVLELSAAGRVFQRDDEEGLNAFLKQIMSAPDKKGIDMHNSQFSRKVITEHLAQILNKS